MLGFSISFINNILKKYLKLIKKARSSDSEIKKSSELKFCVFRKAHPRLLKQGARRLAKARILPFYIPKFYQTPYVLINESPLIFVILNISLSSASTIIEYLLRTSTVPFMSYSLCKPRVRNSLHV